MAQTENLGVLIKLRGEGMELLDQLIGSMDKAGMETGEFRQKADALNRELQQLKQQQDLINQFRSQKDAVTQLANEYEKAQFVARVLAGEIAAADAPTKQQTAEFDRAKTAVKEAAQAYEDGKAKLQTLRQTMGDAGINTRELATANVRVKASLDQTHAAIAKLSLEAKQAAEAQRAFGTLGVRSAKEVEAEITKVRAAMQTLRTTAGISGSAVAQGMQAGEARVKALERELRGINGQLTLTDRAAQAMGGTMGQMFGGNLLAQGATRIADAARQMWQEFVASNIEAQRLAKSLDAIYKNSSTTTSQIAFLRKTAGEAGVEVRGLTDHFVSFSAATKAANIQLEVSNELFASVVKAGATLGLSTDRVGNALMALSQMASKGTVAMEELRGQLGEALPGALGLVAEGLGITDQQLIKLVESGGLAARDMLPALGQALKKMEGDTDTVSGAWGRFKNAMTQAFQGMGEGGGIDLMTMAVKGLSIAVGLVITPLHALVEAFFLLGRAAGGAGAAMAIMTDGSLSWREKLAAMRDIVKDLGEKYDEANARVQATGAAFERAAGLGEKQAEATSKAAQEAAELSKQMVSLGVASAEAAAQQAQQIKNSEKMAAAAKIEGENLTQIAKLRGGAREQLEAELQATRLQGQEINKVADARRALVQTLEGELAAKMKLMGDNPAELKAREVEIKAMREKIEATKAELAVSEQAAAQSKMEIAQREVARKTYEDNSQAIGRLKTAMLEANQVLEQVTQAEQMGIASKGQLAEAQINAAQATALYKDALKDALELMDAKTKTQAANYSMDKALLQLDLERAKTDERRARAAKDEDAVRQAQIKQKEIELKMAMLQIEADNARADASIAAAKAKAADLEASGQMTKAQREAIDASIKAAEAEKVVNKARTESLGNMRDELKRLMTEREKAPEKTEEKPKSALDERNAKVKSIFADRKDDQPRRTPSPVDVDHGTINKPTDPFAHLDKDPATAPATPQPPAQQFASAWQQQPGQAAPQVVEKVYRLTLPTGGQIETNAQGQAAIDAFMRSLEQGKAATGRR